MFDKNPTQEQSLEIDKIVNRFIKAALKSHKETAWHDAERKGMDAVTKYCRDQGLATLGNHMIRANFKIINAES
jgi:post-segregation antitoxin (ccd killing protein)